MVSKIDTGYKKLSIQVTYLQTTYVSVKFMPLHEEAGMDSSLSAYKTIRVHCWNKQNNENKINSRIFVWVILSRYTPKLDRLKNKSTDWTSISNICLVWKVQRKTHLSRRNQSLFTNNIVLHACILKIIIQ